MTTLTADPIKLWVLTLAEHAHVKAYESAIDTTGSVVTVPLCSVEDVTRVGAMLVTLNAEDLVFNIEDNRACVLTQALGRPVKFTADVPGVGA